jgi:CBS domain-containing protein
VRHTLRPTTPRGIALRAAGGMVERWLLPGADAVIALTPSAARLLRGDGIPADRVHVIPPGYDPVLFAAAAADPFPGLPRPRVAYVGRLVPQKDVGTLLDAFARLAAPAQLLVVGDGPDRPALQRRAQPFGSRVHFTGFVPHVQVPAVLRHVDMLVLPSLYEDLSSALIEAMAAGLPVVATRVGGTADLVADGVNGLLVAPRDPAALAAAINRGRIRLARSCPRCAGRLPASDRPRPWRRGGRLSGRRQAPAPPPAAEHKRATALVVLDSERSDRPIGIITETGITQAPADGKDLNKVRIHELITHSTARQQHGDKHP